MTEVALRPRKLGRPVDVTERERKVLDIIETVRGKRPKFKDAAITMAHGAGGKATQTLIEGLFVPAFGSEAGAAMADAGAVGEDLAITTDSFVVKPLRFPGGSIGDLAVNGTVNDLAVSGARPLALSLAMILEEGLSAGHAPRRGRRDRRGRCGGRRRDRRRRHQGRRARPRRRDVPVHHRRRPPRPARVDVAAEPAPRRPHPRLRLDRRARHGDHARARGVRARRRTIESDTRSLWPAVDALLDAAGPELRCMRDATRGGVASVLNELARASGVAMIVREAAVPVHPAVAGAAEILGIDPMYVANEGKLVAFVAPEASGRRAGRAARGSRLRGRRGDRRGEDGAAWDGAGADGVRWQARDGPAGR